MAAGIPGTALAKDQYGIKVSRATAALPATTASAIFTITGGKVAVTAIYGEVTTVIQTQANNTKLQHDPTDTGTTQDLCAVLDISADAVGTMYSLDGTPANAMVDALNFLSSNKQLAKPLILKPGAILLNCAATNTGSVKWDLWYVPLDTGAAVAAA
jgi:hypothetical protein